MGERETHVFALLCRAHQKNGRSIIHTKVPVQVLIGVP
jgi:hypothetical protein